MKFAVAALMGLVGATDIETDFVKFLSEHNKNYATREEYEFRFNIFKTKFNFVQEHNNTEDNHEVSLNHMADWTDMEYKKLLGFKQHLNRSPARETFTWTDAPASIDWRAKGAVTPIKNQGQCGSCWAFSATGSMEGRYQIKSGNLTSLSEQQLVDCSTSEGNQGCNGGLMDNAFTYAETNSMDTESSYPYKGVDGKCATGTAVSKVVGFQDVTKNSPTALMNAVAEGPVSIGVSASALGFQLYHGGILKHFCSGQIDHGVLTVGYGTEKGTDYWIVKNSWGASWGEKGYLRILRTMNKDGAGVCMLQSAASYPTY